MHIIRLTCLFLFIYLTIFIKTPEATDKTVFSDITESSGIPSLKYGEGVNFWDINGDGLPELFLTVARSKNRFFLNQGNGFFKDLTDDIGLVGYGGMGAVFGDINNDGKVDLYVARSSHVEGHNSLYLQKSDGTFFEVKDALGATGKRGTMSVTLADFTRSGTPDIISVGTSGIVIYRNIGKEGNISFIDVTADVGVNISQRAWGVTVSDLNQDGYLDLIVATGSGGEKGGIKFYKNRKDGTFEDFTKQAGLDRDMWAMGILCIDFDGDGAQDIFVTNFGGKDRIFRNNRDGRFIDVTDTSGITSSYSVGVTAGSVTGGVLPDIVVAEFNGPVRLYRNKGNFKFVEVNRKESGLGSYKRNDAVALVDIDDNGSLDLYVANFDGKNRLYRNNLKVDRFIKIKGKIPFGTIASLYKSVDSGHKKSLMATQEMQPSSGFASQLPQEFIFILPKKGEFDVSLKFPDGRIKVIKNAKGTLTISDDATTVIKN